MGGFKPGALWAPPAARGRCGTGRGSPSPRARACGHAPSPCPPMAAALPRYAPPWGGVVTTACAFGGFLSSLPRRSESGGDTFPWESGARGTGGGGERGPALKGPHPAREQSGRGGGGGRRAERRVSGREGRGAGPEGGL